MNYVSRGVRRVGALKFEVTNLSRAVEQVLADAVEGRCEHVHLANAWSVALAESDCRLQEAFETGRNYPDGKSVVWAMRFIGGSDASDRPGRVYGPALFERVLERSVRANVRHYFLGSTPETLEKLQSNIKARYPGVEIVGTSSPPFKELDTDDFACELLKIEASNPHIVWVGLGTPKQDLAGAYLASQHDAVFICVGAAFDFSAGNLRNVPLWIQNVGLAWLFRLVQEPRRLWRRYTYGNAKFISVVLRQLVRERCRGT